jgi:hypothetical protein
MFSVSRTSKGAWGVGLVALAGAAFAPVVAQARTASLDVPAQPAAAGIQALRGRPGCRFWWARG